MAKRIKLIAICVLFIYCSLFLLANSPLHIYLFHRNDNSQTYGYSLTSFPALVKSEGVQECPLCKFLNLTLFPGLASIFIILMAFSYLISLDKYKALYLSKIKYYHALAPPWLFPRSSICDFVLLFNHS